MTFCENKPLKMDLFSKTIVELRFIKIQNQEGIKN